MTLDAHDKTRIDGFTARLVFSAAILQVVCGGIRFVDGSMLVQFSQAGFDARLQDFSQYLFDSPLKIMFLQALGLDSALTIGIIFLVLNFLPVAAVFLVSKNRQERTDLLLIVSVLPIWKLMFQNVGVGDAVMFAGAICLVVARQWMAVTLAAFVIVLWHFQQGAMIVLILCALGVVGQRPEDWGRLKAQIAGGMAGILVFVALTIFLIPPHTGRLGFIVAYMAPFLTKNILCLPIALCAIVPGTILMAEALRAQDRERRGALTIAAIALTALAIGVGTVTMDFSRVMLLLTFPIVLFLANPRTAPLQFLQTIRSPSHLVPLLAISVVTPIFSWSGVDVYLWGTLPATFHKYLGTAL